MTIDQSRILRPSRVRPHDCIGIVAPAGPVSDSSRLQAGVAYLERLGYRTKVAPHAEAVHGYLAGTDAERAADLMAMFLDPGVQAIICLRGGFGSTRILPLLDFELIKRHPKVFSGFSDITALQLALWHRCLLVTFHGPMLAPDFSGALDSLTESSFWGMVSGDDAAALLPLCQSASARTLFPGQATGRLLGGNLSLLSVLVGTPFIPDFTGSLLYIEEVGEEPYRVDRALTHLTMSGIFSRANGVVAGEFSNCTPKDPSRPTLSVERLLEDLAGSLRVPFSAGCLFGHVPSKLTLPTGVLAQFNADEGMLKLMEPAVF